MVIAKYLIFKKAKYHYYKVIYNINAENIGLRHGGIFNISVENTAESRDFSINI